MERLQKYMARCGVASRRKCEEYIQNGLVKVNGKIVDKLGEKINQNDIVEFNGDIVKPVDNKVYIALNKPKGYITSVKDERGRKTVIDIININERIFPIGRLDYNTSGLLLLTNDGDIYNKIIHPRVKIDKVYEAIVKGKFTEKEKSAFEKGVDIGDYITSESKIETIETYKDKSKVIITIHEGKNRQVRRMCAAFNHDVVDLKRISVGEIKLGKLKIGSFRYLSDKEVTYLKGLGN